MQIKQQLDQYFENHTKEMLDDIAKLVSIDSVTAPATKTAPFGEGTEKALACALEIAQRDGFTVKNFENYVGTIDYFADRREAELGMLAHLDVVAVGDGWTQDPFTCIERDGKIFGRGTADDKGPAMAAYYAMKAIKDLGIPLKKNVRLILGTDEECGSSDIRYYFQKESAPHHVFSPDADFPLINIEKGGLRNDFTAEYPEEDTLPRIRSIQGGHTSNVVPQNAEAVIEGISKEQVEVFCKEAEQRTGVTFTVSQQEDLIHIDALGKGSHAAMPSGGNNAVTALIDLLCSMPFAKSEGFDKLCAVHRIFPHGDWLGKAAGIAMEDEISHELTISFDIFRYSLTGFTGNFDCRSPICANDENVRDVLIQKFADAGIHMSDKPMKKPHHVKEDDPFVETLLKCYEDYTGREGYCMAIGGGTYVHSIEGGVAFGCSMPETENRMHGPDEFAVIEELVVSAKIFAQVIVDLCAE